MDNNKDLSKLDCVVCFNDYVLVYHFNNKNYYFSSMANDKLYVFSNIYSALRFVNIDSALLKVAEIKRLFNINFEAELLGG